MELVLWFLSLSINKNDHQEDKDSYNKISPINPANKHMF